MLTTPMDVLNDFPVRKSKQEKQAFLEAVQAYVQGMGYTCTVEEGSFGSRNLVMGDPEQAEFLVTAHYDTPAKRRIPNVCTPTSLLRTIGKLIVTFLLFGLLGFCIGYFLGKSKLAPGIILFSCPFIHMLFKHLNRPNPNNANDNTSGVVTVLEIMRTLPQMHRNRVCFVLFDLEELGLIGSASYRKAHKEATEKQIVLNLDCIGDGDEIWFFPSKKLKQDSALMQKLIRCSGWFGQKQILIRDKGFASYPSDHQHFPLSAGIGAFHNKKGVGPYLTRIHTEQDTILDETNVNILRACISTLISCDGT